MPGPTRSTSTARRGIARRLAETGVARVRHMLASVLAIGGMSAAADLERAAAERAAMAALLRPERLVSAVIARCERRLSKGQRGGRWE